MKIISWNVNGVKSVYKKGFLDCVKSENPDILCLQEIKIDETALLRKIEEIDGYKGYYKFAQKKGYAGVAIYTKWEPIRVTREISLERFDCEGRFLEVGFENCTLINLYMPHSGRQKENLAYKLECYEYILEYLKGKKNVILAGDFNIARNEIDLAELKTNVNNIMFIFEERGKIDCLSGGFIDSFRFFDNSGGNYTWRPYMAKARERNLGWRIDCIWVTVGLEKEMKNTFILKDIKGSDHCPIGLIAK